MAVTPENLLLDQPFRSLVQPPPGGALAALQQGLADAWQRLAGGAKEVGLVARVEVRGDAKQAEAIKRGEGGGWGGQGTKQAG